jgi:hypothetical protein
MIKADSIREAENIDNDELSKISAWTKENKIRFNEQKSKVMLMTRRKRKELREIEIYLSNKLLLQAHSLKCLGIIYDTKLSFREHIKMYKIDICAFQIGKAKLGAEKCSPEDNTHRSNTTSPPIRSTSVVKSHR